MKEVTAAIIFRGNRVLLTRRAPDQKLAGYWEFPGGKVESGESPQQCLQRELLEELGVASNPTYLLAESEYVYEHGAFKLIAILTELQSSDFELRVHDKAEWVDPIKLLDYKLLPADIPIAKEVIKNAGI